MGMIFITAFIEAFMYFHLRLGAEMAYLRPSPGDAQRTEYLTEHDVQATKGWH